MLTNIPIKLAFKKKNPDTGIFGKVISFVTRSEFYHVEIIIGDLWVGFDAPDGLSINNLKPLKYDHWEYVPLYTEAIEKEKYDEVMAFVESMKDKKYDYLAIIFSQLLPFGIHSKQKVFCSELVTMILQLLEHPKVKNLKPQNVSPKDLARLFNLKG